MKADEVFAVLKKRIEQGGVTDETIKKIVEQYFEEHPVQVITDNTLSVAGAPADALSTGNAIKNVLDSFKDIFLEKFFSLQRTGKVYGVKVFKSTFNPTSICEKTRDNAGLICEPSTDTVENQDDYENIPLFKWYEVNYKRYNDGFAYPTAFIGDSNYKTDSDADIGAMQMTFYYAWLDVSDEYRELVISDTPHEELGLKPWEQAVRADGTIMPYFIQSRHSSVIGSDGLLHSQRGKVARNQSYQNMITNYGKKGTGYTGAGSSRFTFAQIFNLIKYANKSSQDSMAGVTNWNVQYPASIQSIDKHNYFPVTNAQANNMQVGLCVSVGYGNTSGSLDRELSTIHQYADDVKIIAIEALDDNNKAVYLDCQPFDTTPVDDRQIYITSMQAHSGDTDSVIGHHDGSPVSNTDGKHPCRIQGIEIMVGGGEVASDTVAFFNTDYSKNVYHAPIGVKHTTNEATIKATYELIGNIAASSNGEGSDYWSGDVEHINGAWLPKNQVGNSGQGNKDMLYAGGKMASGVRQYYQGGYLRDGANAGFCYLNCRNRLDRAGWYYLSAD
jgi:hypothetical protein